jgi:hypothetical protein
LQRGKRKTGKISIQKSREACKSSKSCWEDLEKFQSMLGKPEKVQWHKCGKAEAKRKKNLERFRGTLGKPGKVLRQVRET